MKAESKNKFKRWLERGVTMFMAYVIFYNLIHFFSIPESCLAVGMLFVIWVITKCITSRDFLSE